MSDELSSGDDERGPRERAYDEHIAPLMARIIELSKEHDIPMLASFQLDGDMVCTTVILTSEDADPKLIAASHLIRGTRPAMDVVTRDADGNITNMTRIL